MPIEHSARHLSQILEKYPDSEKEQHLLLFKRLISFLDDFSQLKIQKDGKSISHPLNEIYNNSLGTILQLIKRNGNIPTNKKERTAWINRERNFLIISLSVQLILILDELQRESPDTTILAKRIQELIEHLSTPERIATLFQNKPDELQIVVNCVLSAIGWINTTCPNAGLENQLFQLHQLAQSLAIANPPAPSKRNPRATATSPITITPADQLSAPPSLETTRWENIQNAIRANVDFNQVIQMIADASGQDVNDLLNTKPNPRLHNLLAELIPQDCRREDLRLFAESLIDPKEKIPALLRTLRVSLIQSVSSGWSTTPVQMIIIRQADLENGIVQYLHSTDVDDYTDIIDSMIAELVSLARVKMRDKSGHRWGCEFVRIVKKQKFLSCLHFPQKLSRQTLLLRAPLALPFREKIFDVFTK